MPGRGGGERRRRRDLGHVQDARAALSRRECGSNGLFFSLLGTRVVLEQVRVVSMLQVQLLF